VANEIQPQHCGDGHLADVNALPLPSLFSALSATGLVRRLLELARDEDLGEAGDVTSLVAIAPTQQGRAQLVARSGGIISGLAVIPELISVFAPDVAWHPAHDDGVEGDSRCVLGTLTGPLRQILALERTMLNLVARLSGIATLTAQYVRALPGGTRAGIYDTRKTTPGNRVLEKYAVRCGGGRCHRLGLHDAMLIKDNHIAGVTPSKLAAFVQDAATRARAMRALYFVEVEVDTLDQFEALLTLPPGLIDIVLLDNMSPDLLREAARRREHAQPRLELEASGGVTLGTLPLIASTGVDRISVGALTHHAVSRDVALDVVSE
jgi:nicotinate-nucleotide pyrophosphorylase (carboxylating)